MQTHSGPARTLTVYRLKSTCRNTPRATHHATHARCCLPDFAKHGAPDAAALRLCLRRRGERHRAHQALRQGGQQSRLKGSGAACRRRAAAAAAAAAAAVAPALLGALVGLARLLRHTAPAKRRQRLCPYDCFIRTST